MLVTLELTEYANNVINLAVYAMVVHLISVSPAIQDSTSSTTAVSPVTPFALAVLVLPPVNVSTAHLVISS